MSTDRLLLLRQDIDALDDQLVVLLNQRAALSREVGSLKAQDQESIFKPFREKEVLERLGRTNKGDLPEEHLRAIYREILSSSRRLQRPQRIAYLGPEGTFTHQAALEYLGHSMDLVSCASLPAVFMQVSTRKVDLGVIPLENSLQGSVGQSLDLFLQYKVFIHAEVFCRIHHALLASTNTLQDIKTVYSHSQALAQCSTWLRQHLPQSSIIPVESTAAAARLAEEQGFAAAAVGHPRLAEHHELRVIAQDIQDLPDNRTRFLVIGGTPTQHARKNKTSLLLTTKNEPGALAAVLNLLAEQGLNLTKLESRPARDEQWRYVFFMDVECDLSAEQYTSTMERLRQLCHTMRILGSYPAGGELAQAYAGELSCEYL